MNRVLVTGAAGFIGFHVCRTLLQQGREVVGLDNLNSYYDVRLKEDRLAQLTNHPQFTFLRADIADRAAMESLFSDTPFAGVIHLAAQAGVRYSLTHPHEYIEANLVGFLNILEGCRHAKTPHLVYASSSSVYGSNRKLPFSTADNVDHPVSLYAATKKADELMAHVYSHLYELPTTGLRFFTVYGPWGRPDMALFKFTRAILAGEPIEVYNFGQMRRDFTYIDDIATAVVKLLDHIPHAQPDSSSPAVSATGPYAVYNIGNNQPVELMELIATLEESLGLKAEKKMLPMQPGDVPATFADVEDLAREIGFRPATPIAEGVQRFVEWYRTYYGV